MQNKNTSSHSPKVPSFFIKALMGLAFCASIFFSTNLYADEKIFEATYKGEFSGWRVEMVRTLSKGEDQQYKFTSFAENMLASLTEESVFKKTNDGIQSLSYLYLRKVFGKKKEETVNFDWVNSTAEYKRSDRSDRNTSHTLNGGELDPALYQLLLQRDVYLNKDKLSFTFVKDRRIKTYNFEHLGEDKIKIHNKTYKALKLHRSNAEDSDTFVWLVPELDYQIGKLVHKDDGSTYEVEMIRYRANRDAVKAFYETAS